MTLLVTIAFFMAVAGCFIMLELSPFVFLEGLSGYLKPKNHTMKNHIKESKKKKEPKGLKRLFEEVKEILRLTGKSEQFTMLCVLAMILFVLGVMIALTMNNAMLVPVLAVGFALLPFYYVKFTASKHKKQINTELETEQEYHYSGNRGKSALLKSAGIGSVPELSHGGETNQFQHCGSFGRIEKGDG